MRTTLRAELAYGVMRGIIGILFACHGAQILFGAFGKPAAAGDPKMFVGGGIELIAGVLIAAGLMTSIAAFLASGEMAVAYFMAHAPRGFWPIENQGELAVVYCFLFLTISAVGGGLYSLDALRSRRHGPRETFSPATLTRARMDVRHDPRS